MLKILDFSWNLLARKLLLFWLDLTLIFSWKFSVLLSRRYSRLFDYRRLLHFLYIVICVCVCLLNASTVGWQNGSVLFCIHRCFSWHEWSYKSVSTILQVFLDIIFRKRHGWGSIRYASSLRKIGLFFAFNLRRQLILMYNSCELHLRLSSSVVCSRTLLSIMVIQECWTCLWSCPSNGVYSPAHFKFHVFIDKIHFCLNLLVSLPFPSRTAIVTIFK